MSVYQNQLSAFAIAIQVQYGPHGLETPTPILIGPVGTGKTSVAAQIAASLKVQFGLWSIAQVMPELLGGFPYADLEQ